MKSFNFKILHDNRKNFIKQNTNKDHVVIVGESGVIISAPHGVSQTRLGKLKFREIGSLTTALCLQGCTKSFLIAKTKNNNDDANFDVDCEYRKTLRNLITKNKIKYLIDFHGLSEKWGCDVNLGVNFGHNVERDLRAFESLCSMLKHSDFVVSVDKPFMAGVNTISGSMKKEFDSLFTLQIEINCAITNKIDYSKKYEKLLNVFENWIKTLK